MRDGQHHCPSIVVLLRAIMTKACSNRIILALLAIGLWVYFVIICFDCQPAIAAIRDKKDPTTRSRDSIQCCHET